MAHETGHNFGCAHDDEVRPSVKGFVMQNSAPLSATRFSRLADFGGTHYSSSLMIKEFILKRSNCMLGYILTSQCGEVQNLDLQYVPGADSSYISWKETESVFIRLKEQVNTGYNVIWEKEFSGNKLAIGGLKSCQQYELEISKVCGSDKGETISLQLRIPSVFPVSIDTLLHTALYDLRLKLNGNNQLSPTTKIVIDNAETRFQWKASKNEITVLDLVSDGRKHKLEIKDTLLGIPCHFKTSYIAPDSRKHASVLLKEDLNDCKFPAGWKDSVVKQIATPAFNFFKWNVAPKSVPNTFFQVGSFDSSCFLFYQANLNPMGCCGARFLMSPKIDVTAYKDISFSFDYLLKTFKEENKGTAYFRVEVFNGNQWIKIFEKSNDIPRPLFPFWINIWDSIPQRVQLSLDAYKNKDLQLRFNIDDGFMYNDQNRLQVLQYFIGLDNIKVDGIKIEEPAPAFTIAPNPVRDVIRIHFAKPFTGVLQYKIIDIKGRLVDKGTTQNYRIALRNMSYGLYFLQLYNGKVKIGPPKKFLFQN
jgi:hypothetical protein